MLISMFSFAQNSYQQNLNNLSPLSPTSSAIATYVDYPVDYKTGIPDITIPLFEVPTKTGTIPFSLSYHVGKIKSSEFTGPVGLGWSLMPEMGITRSKRGKEDDIPLGYDVPANSPNCQDQLKFAQGLFNTEPDDFYYSLLSKQGKFLYNKTNNFSTIPFEAIKINRPDKYSFLITDNDGTIYQFGKDLQGNQMLEFATHSVGDSQTLDSWKITVIKSFDGAETIRFFYNAPVSHTIRNYISQYKIIHNKDCPTLDVCTDAIKETMYNGTYYQNSVTVGWKYMKPGISSLPSVSTPFRDYNEIAPYTDNISDYSLVDFPRPIYSPANNELVPAVVRGESPEMDSNIIQEHTIKELPLKEIIFNNGKVTYDYSGDKLTKLSLYNQIDGVYHLLKYAVFTYSNLYDAGNYNFINYNMDRYTLDAVIIYDAGGTAKNNYKLDYTTHNLSNIPLAMNTACDIWGYPYDATLNSMPKMRISLKVLAAGNNAITKMNVLIGRQRFLTVEPNGLSEFDFPPLLKKITYPTNGSAEFTFERNQFKNVNGTSGIGLKAGGFRISKVSYLTDQNVAKTKVYKYGKDELGYGEVKYFPNKGDFMYDQVFRNSSGNYYVETTINSSPFKSLLFSGGAAVLYPEVTEYEAILNSVGDITDYNGKTKYEYSISGVAIRRSNTPLQGDYRDEWNSSYLKKKTVSDRNNAPLMDETYNYTTFSIDDIPVLQAFQRYFSKYNTEDICQIGSLGTYGGYSLLGSSNQPTDYIRYNIPVGILLLTKKITAFYNGVNPITTSQTFTYDPDNFFLKSTLTTINNTNTLRTTNYYPKDLITTPFMNNMFQVNRINTPVKIEQFNNERRISQTSTSYNQDATTSNLLLPKEVFTKKGLEAIDLNFDKKLTYDRYDDRGNILQYTIESGSPVSFIWGYNKTLPLAKIENASYDLIMSYVANLQSLSDVDDDNCMSVNCKEQILRNGLNALRSSFSKSMITTYTYNPLVGLTSLTDAKGISSYYEYDSLGRLKFVKDKDLNVLQKYCYNYKGQQIDCSDNTSTSIFYYKSAPINGSFTKNNCPAGSTGSSVPYSQGFGAVTSTISQIDADTRAMDKFNIDGLANASSSSSATCTFYSIARSGSFVKNNCSAGGIGSSVPFSQLSGIVTSTISQIDADTKGLDKFNTDGLVNANSNTSATCTFYNVAKNVVFTRNNCAAGGSPASITYNVPAGRYNSNASQVAADAQAQNEVNNNGQAFANNDANAKCTFYNVAKNVVFTRNNCAVGGNPANVNYNVAAGKYNSNVSQTDVDAQAQDEVNNNGQVFANNDTNAKCTFWNSAKSRAFRRYDCVSGASGSLETFKVPAGSYSSTISQADADAIAQSFVDNNGQNYADTTGTCTFGNSVKSKTANKNDCGTGKYGSPVTYTVATGTYTSSISKADADSKAQADVNSNYQTYANTNGVCTSEVYTVTMPDYEQYMKLIYISVNCNTAIHPARTISVKISYQWPRNTAWMISKDIILPANATYQDYQIALTFAGTPTLLSFTVN